MATHGNFFYFLKFIRIQLKYYSLMPTKYEFNRITIETNYTLLKSKFYKL